MIEMKESGDQFFFLGRGDIMAVFYLFVSSGNYSFLGV